MALIVYEATAAMAIHLQRLEPYSLVKHNPPNLAVDHFLMKK